MTGATGGPAGVDGRDDVLQTLHACYAESVQDVGATYVPLLSALVASAEQQLESGVAELLQVFAAMSGAAEEITAAASGRAGADPAVEALRQHLATSLVHLQFGDRLLQKLTHLRGGLDRLGAALAVPGRAPLPPVDTRALLADLEHSYTTPEERRVHGGGGPAARAPDVTTCEITFF